MDTHRTTILVIDDDDLIRQSLKAILTAKGYHVLQAASGEEGITLAADQHPALVLLDLRMPGMGGFKTCETLRDWYHEPILVLSVLEGEQDMVRALHLGADDYLTKPYQPTVLLARIEAHLRRMQQLATPSCSPVIVAGTLQIDLTQHRVTRNGGEVHLTPIEYRILVLLARQAGCVVTTATLLHHLWGDAGTEMQANPLHTHITHLRQKIALTPESQSPICTEDGVGFRFISGGEGELTGQ